MNPNPSSPTLEPVTETSVWAGVSGADTAQVTRGAVSVSACGSEEMTLAGVSINRSGNHQVIALGRTARLRSLTLSGFTYRPEGADEDLDFSPGEDARLVVSIPDPRLEWLPVYGIPEVSSATSPKLYSGARLDGSSLILPSDMPLTDRLRLSVVNHFTGENEDTLFSTLADATARALNLPEDLTVSNETEASVLFRHEGPYLDGMPAVTLDMANHAQATFDRQLAAGEPLTFQWRVSAGDGGAFCYAAEPVGGALLRSFRGVTTARLAGEPLELPLDLRAGPLDGESPASVTCDLNLRYDGLRLLERYDDPLPDGPGDLTGLIVRDVPVARELLDPTIATYPVARVGILGRAPESCELSVWLAARQGDRPGPPLGAPGVAQVNPDTDMRIVWVDLPEPVTHDSPLILRVRANTGRFFWLTDPEPRVRVAVRDPDPGNRPVMLQEHLLYNLNTQHVQVPKIDLPAALFTGSLPILCSRLFVTVELTDVTMRYDR